MECKSDTSLYYDDGLNTNFPVQLKEEFQENLQLSREQVWDVFFIDTDKVENLLEKKRSL